MCAKAHVNMVYQEGRDFVMEYKEYMDTLGELIRDPRARQRVLQ